MQRYENQNIHKVFDHEEKFCVTSLSYEEYLAIEQIAGYTKYGIILTLYYGKILYRYRI